jgi:hypothetical protein
MTVADILYAYTQRANYTNVTSWDGIGFCLHSDWALGYFASEYHIALHGQWEAYENSTIAGRGQTGECRNQQLSLCHANATICHYMTPPAMILRMKNSTSPELKALLRANDQW